MPLRKDFHHEPLAGRTLTALSVRFSSSLWGAYAHVLLPIDAFFYRDIIAGNLECVKGVFEKSFMLAKHHASTCLKGSNIGILTKKVCQRTQNLGIFSIGISIIIYCFNISIPQG